MTAGGKDSAFYDDIMTDTKSRVYQFDDVRVEAEAFKVFKRGRPAELEPKALRVLLYLIEHRGRLVEKGELLDAVWKDTNVTENAMTREIAKLRKLLGDNAKEPRYIQTVHTRGYRFIAEVTELNRHAAAGNGGGALAVAAPTEAGAPAQAISLSDAPRVARVRGRRVFKILLLSGALGLLLFGAFMLGVYLVWKYTPHHEPLRAISPRVTRITTWPGLDVNPTLSPDGSAIAYSSDHNGGFELYVRQLVGGGHEIQLTNDGAGNFDPAWSPDGKLIAYHSQKRGGIWLVPAFGGVARQLTDFGAHPAWSRDGAWLAFQSEPAPDIGAIPVATSTLWLVSAQGGAPRQLTQAGIPVGSHLAPTWSPDGKRVAFLNATFRTTQIWSVTSDGRDPKELTQVGTGDKGEPVYSPNGGLLYFTRAGVLWRRNVAPDGGLTNEPPVKVADMGDATIHHLSFSGDGQRLAYSAWTQTSNLWTLTLAADRQTPVDAPTRLTNETGTRNMQPAFTPDGRRIAFIERRRGGSQDVWTMDSDGRNHTPLTTTPGWRDWPRWSQDANEVIFEATREGKRTLVSVTPATGKEETLTALDGTIEYPQLAPDGQRIACNIRTDGAVNVATMPARGGPLKQLTFERGLLGFPCWSPDGKLLALEMRRGDDTHIAIMPSDGGAPLQLTYAHGQSWPYGWSPDGDKIIFAAERAGIWNLWWVSRTDKTVRQLTNYSKPNAYVRYPAWSPLGTQIAYEYSETTGNIYVLDSK